MCEHFGRHGIRADFIFFLFCMVYTMSLFSRFVLVFYSGACLLQVIEGCVHNIGVVVGRLAYEQFRFCETFHSDDAGWRTCNSCKKRVHCGCIASVYGLVLLDKGGVECSGCAQQDGAVASSSMVMSVYQLFSPRMLRVA
jgi:hypothetical protein